MANLKNGILTIAFTDNFQKNEVPSHIYIGVAHNLGALALTGANGNVAQMIECHRDGRRLEIPYATEITADGMVIKGLEKLEDVIGANEFDVHINRQGHIAGFITRVLMISLVVKEVEEDDLEDLEEDLEDAEDFMPYTAELLTPQALLTMIDNMSFAELKELAADLKVNVNKSDWHKTLRRKIYNELQRRI